MRWSKSHIGVLSVYVGSSHLCCDFLPFCCLPAKVGRQRGAYDVEEVDFGGHWLCFLLTPAIELSAAASQILNQKEEEESTRLTVLQMFFPLHNAA